MKKNDKMMVLSGLLGFSFFLIANFTDIFIGLGIVSGLLQICLNAFVFITWLKGFRTSSSLKKFVAFWGIVVPVIMASITFIRVLLPTFLGLFS